MKPLVLILVRHAKSDWGDPTLDDHDRPLNARGRRDAPRIGAWLARAGYRPQEAQVSSARRTRETWDAISQALSDPPEATHLPALYHAAPDTILAQAQTARHPVLLVVGHNPGIGIFAQEILTVPPDHPRFQDYPTGATLVAQFNLGSWRDLARHTGTAGHFVTPHDLT